MPLVRLDKNYSKILLDREIRKKKAEFRISNRDMATWLGVSERGVTYKRKEGCFSFKDLSILFDRLKFSDEEIIKVFKKG